MNRKLLFVTFFLFSFQLQAVKLSDAVENGSLRDVKSCLDLYGRYMEVLAEIKAERSSASETGIQPEFENSKEDEADGYVKPLQDVGIDIAYGERDIMSAFIRSTLMGVNRKAINEDIVKEFLGRFKFDEETLVLLRERKHPYVIVANKIDKLNQKELSAQLKQIRTITGESEIVLCSTVAQGGTDAIYKRLFLGN